MTNASFHLYKILENNMRNTITLICLSICIFCDSLAVELVCKGEQQNDPSQKMVQVDCTNRKAVIDVLGSAWRTLRKEGIGGSTEDMCWRPFNRAKELHPSISMNGIASTFLAECNMALQYIN
jgi:hypothetical protein